MKGPAVWETPPPGVAADLRITIEKEEFAFLLNGTAVFLGKPGRGWRVEGSVQDIERLRSLWRLRWAE